MIGVIINSVRRALRAGLSVALICVLSIGMPRTAVAEECKSCAKGGGEGSGGGGKASDVLFGLAAIMAAVSPMVAAAIQADADKQIAKTNAEAQKTMTQMSADTSKYLADQQQNIAMGQAEIAAKMANDNQKATTDRLDMQLAELNVARQEAAALEQKKFDYQKQLDDERVALAKAQANENQKLAAKQMRAQLAAAGLSQGFASSTNSAVSGSSTSVASAGSSTIPKSSTGLGTSAVGVTKTSAKTTTSNAARAVSSTNASGVSLGSGLGNPTQSLALSTGSKSTGKKGVAKPKPAATAAKSSALVNATRGVTTQSQPLPSPELQLMLGKNSLARGSTSTVRLNGKKAPSDLQTFSAKTLAMPGVPQVQRGISSVSASDESEAPSNWAPTYNPPEIAGEFGGRHRR